MKIIVKYIFTNIKERKMRTAVMLQIGGEPVSFQVAEIAAYDTVFLRHTYTAVDPDAVMVQICGLIGKPEILFADEPTGNLDSKTGTGIMDLFREINESIGQTIIMVTHSPEAARSSTRMIIVQDGIIT